MPKFSVKKPFVVLVAVVMLLVLGAVSFIKMTTDFLPNMNMPYMIVITTYPGASPEKVEMEITEIMESAVGTVNGVKNVSSSSAENSSVVSLEFEEDTNMDAAMVKVSSAVNQVPLPENAGTPMLMQISADMMATMMTSVDYEGKSGYELSKFIEDNIVPELERQDGVASVNASGLVEKSIEVCLDQDKIDDVNTRILEKTNKSLAKAKRELDKAEKKLKEGKEQLSSQKKELEDQQNEKSSELAKFSKMMNQALATKEAYVSNLTSLQAKQSALKMEKEAYQKNKVVDAYNQMNAGFKALRDSMEEGGAAYQGIYSVIYNQVLVVMVQAQLEAAGIDGAVTAENVDTYLAQLGEGSAALKEAAAGEAAKQAKEQHSFRQV